MQKPLTRKDRKKLQQKIGFVGLFTLAAIAIFYAIFSFVLKDSFSNNSSFDAIPTVIFGIFALIFAGIIGYLVWILRSDLNNGVKNCFEGIVEDKKLSITQSSSSSAGRRSGRNTKTKRDYYIVVDNTQHKIDHSMYYAVKVGDTIYFEVTPKSNVILHYKILENAVAISTSNTTSYSKANYPSSKIKQAPLSQKDKDVLHDFYKQKAGSRLKTIAFISLPIIGLLANGLGVFLVFLFPLPIVVLYQTYKLIKLRIHYKRSIEEGRKELIRTQITDKLFTTFSSNSKKQNKRTLQSTYGAIQVSELLYDKINTSDEIIIHKALFLQCLLGIDIDETYYSM